MKKILLPISIIFAVTSISLATAFFLNDKNVSVIKYFPLDETSSFSDAETDLKLLSETDQDEYNVEWNSFSDVEEPIYLRQDVSLLYIDGRLKGILSKWKENARSIELNSSIHGEDSSHFQAVTFHHGELHYPDDEIKSIQTMTADELYVIDSPHSALESFDQPTNSTQKEWKNTLDHATNQQLSYHWNKLLKYFQIPKNKYKAVPLTELHKYQTKSLPNLTLEQSQQVIGQLWEGLYKNYILGVPGDNKKNKPLQSFVPIILFEKEGKHLLVLYQDGSGKKQQLIQYYPFERR